MKNRLKFEYKFTLIYLIVGALWILFSDKLLNFIVHDELSRANFQMYKGWFYVLITALLLFFLLKKHLTEQRNAEKLLEKNNKALSEAHKKAKESSRLKTAFMNNISHELRTPMNGIMGFSELLATRKLDKEKKILYSDLIKNSSKQLLSIVTDLIEISQIQQGQTKVNKNSCNLYILIKQIFEKHVKTIQSKGLKYNLKIDDVLNEIEISTDCYKIKRSLNHIIDNSIKFTKEGKIQINVELRENDLFFSIIDTGIGISDEIKQIIFDPFRQAEIEDSKRSAGNGIGLTIAHSYIELLGGSLWIESEVGIGTKVNFSFPKESLDIKNLKFQEHHNTNNIKNRNVLIVDDETINYLYLKELLSDKQVNVLFAENGQKAVDICKNDKTLDLILMDIKMPIMDGFKATELIREFNNDIPIIAQSAYDPGFFGANRESFTGYIAKPIRESDLIKLISLHL